MYMCPVTTFYTHPDGTYAFYDDAWIYNPQGVCNGGNFAQYADTLASFDASLLENVIFDSVHFRFRSALGFKTHQTTFVELYNKAVTAGKKAGTLEAGIELMTSADLQASFLKEEYTWVGAPINGMKWLNLKATRNGASWHFQETAIQGGTAYDFALVPKQGGLVGLSFYNGRWQPDSGSNPAYIGRFMRFADPLVISALR
jgi:hypothetical protein